ncbi:MULTISPECIES: hypothetical protein [unclassified Ensifer]|uniref:hypothetical protein n=1 Tax=unclassified Ensifer TaxID=2633371 RepID=UPI00081321B6|nr:MULTISPECIES: hypothetical protein [unclassified Ensifer]OCP07985.1 hypothetical protein BC362_10265 [Ensifer sp. LC14]OCP10905.1 hypothetical protein BC374_17700 [Ensifer sp. LC13]OCP11549.1 hypothetical protein BBX50_18155 [Ensifer sp. LC11]OCP33368.1 hypothetical protein BC364_17045 [Ensifer sp. LC499]
MKLELDLCDTIRDLLIAGLPDIGGRILVDQKFPTDKRYWPCVLVWMPRVDYRHTGKRIGHRPRTGLPALTITVADDGSKPEIGRSLALLGQQIDDILTGSESLQDGGLTLSWSQSDVARHNGAMLAVRQLGYGLTYETREGETTETIGSR